MEERRKIPRERMFLSGSLAFNNRNSTADCFIRNWSDQGAKIAIPRTATAPGEFDLVVPARGQIRRAELVWRHGDEAGVRFIAGEQARAPAAPARASSYREREADCTW